MPGTEPETPEPTAPRQYLWPKLLLAAVVLGVLLSILWVNREVQRTRYIREMNQPASSTNSL